jgi:anti-anti-sigma factor
MSKVKNRRNGRQMEQKNEIQIEKREDVILIDITGDVTAHSEPFLNEAYRKAKDEGVCKIILKFNTNDYINSGGIAVIIQLLAESKRNNERIVITGLSDHFKKIFNLVGISKFARIYNTVDECLECLSESV